MNLQWEYDEVGRSVLGTWMTRQTSPSANCQTSLGPEDGVRR